jgi:LDH2 family malate/lactate/ureidoglycolate dehydrogenase
VVGFFFNPISIAMPVRGQVFWMLDKSRELMAL